MTKLLAGRPCVSLSIRSKGNNSPLFLRSVQIVLRSAQLRNSVGTGREGVGDFPNHLPSLSAEVKNEWIYTFSTYTSLGNHRDIFILTLILLKWANSSRGIQIRLVAFKFVSWWANSS